MKYGSTVGGAELDVVTMDSVVVVVVVVAFWVVDGF